MQAVISGQAVPVLTKGIVLYSGKLTSDGGVAAGDPIYGDNAQGGQLSKNATTDSAASPRVGTALGSIDDHGFVLIKLDL
jgi:hypothetical protein